MPKVCRCMVCSKCGALEVEDCSIDVLEWKWNIRAYKVCDKDGYWWSFCRSCNSWF